MASRTGTNGHNGAENHTLCQDYFSANPDELVPYLTPVFGDCTIAGVRKNYQLTKHETIGNNGTAKTVTVGIGDFDLLLEVATPYGRKLVPVEVKGNEHHDLGQARSQLLGYKRAIREGAVLQPVSDSEIRYGLVIRGCPPNSRIDGVDFEEELKRLEQELADASL